MSENLKFFRLQCINCDSLKRIHHTELFVNWKKYYYLLTCQNCDTIEAFDKEGRRIDSKADIAETPETPETPKKEKKEVKRES